MALHNALLWHAFHKQSRGLKVLFDLQGVRATMNGPALCTLCLLLGQLVCSVYAHVPNQNDYKVDFNSIFGISDELYSGFMPILLEQPNVEGGFFFWLAKRRNKRADAGKDKLVVWLNGGPGCSSMVGMMWENGPFSLHDKEASDPPSLYNGQSLPYTLRPNPHSWNNEASVLYVEQPIRTGYSKAAHGAR